jgi:hypothetical protein
MSDENVINMALKCANNYYCTYCEKCVSSNNKCIEDRTNNKPHKKYRKIHIYSNAFA